MSLADKAIFTATTADSGTEVWITDGTAAGTMMLADIAPGAASSDPAQYVQANGTVYFTADDGIHGAELWATDGTTAGTRLLGDNNPGPQGSDITNITANGQYVVFQGTDDEFLAYPNVYDEQYFTTTNIEFSYRNSIEINPVRSDAPDPASNPIDFVPLNGLVYYLQTFSTSSGEDRVPAVSYGPGEATVLLDPSPTTQGGDEATDLTRFGNLVVYAADDFYISAQGVKVDLGRQLYTIGNPLLPPDPVAGGSDPSDITVSGDRIFFAGSGPNGSAQLWTSTLAPGSTIPLTALNLAGNFDPTDITKFAGGVLFDANDGATGEELWFSDGTVAGTRMVADINPTGDASPTDLTVVGQRAFFTATDGIQGTELWVTDGTAAGTRMVSDINPGTAGSDPSSLAVFGNELLFAADDGVDGSQLWTTDGTTTRMITDQTSAEFSPTDITALVRPTITTWLGGTGRYDNPALWSFGVPQVGDTAILTSGGTIIAANQTLTGSTVAADAYEDGATLALTGATLAASEAIMVSDPVFGASSDITVTGPVLNAGKIVAQTINALYPNLFVGDVHITVSDIAARSGAVIAPGVLQNSGLIETDGSLITVAGATSDTAFINNGAISDAGQMVFDIALRGTGTIALAETPGDRAPQLELARSVGSGQAIDLGGVGALLLDDPNQFAGSIKGLLGGSVELHGFVAVAESFANGKLSLTGGGMTVTLALPEISDLAALAISSSDGNTLITSSGATLPVPMVTPYFNIAPNPATPPSLPEVYKNGYLSSGVLTGYNQTLHGTTLLGSANGSSVPSINITQVVLAPDSVIASNAAPTSGTATPYATLNVVGTDTNNGQILANSSQGLFRLSVADLRDANGLVLETGALQNRGTLAATADHLTVTGITIDTQLVNTGLISATDHATIDLNIAVMGLGSIQLSGGSTLNVGESVGAQQTVAMDPGSDATLALAHVGSFAGTITNFDAGDTIKLTAQDFDIAGYAGHTLNLVGSSGTASLSIADASSAAAFAVSHVGGSTLITHLG